MAHKSGQICNLKLNGMGTNANATTKLSDSIVFQWSTPKFVCGGFSLFPIFIFIIRRTLRLWVFIIERIKNQNC